MEIEVSNKLPFVSVIVLSYNSEKYLEECIKSLLNLNYPKDKYEIIVADNNSNDNSVEIVKSKFPGIKVIAFDKNYGFAGGNNRAVKYAKGEYVIFLNPDTKVDKNWLIELVRCIKNCNDDKIVACGSKVLFMDDQERIMSAGLLVTPVGAGMDIGFMKIETKDEFNKKRYILSATGASLMIKKDVFLEVGGFDEDFFAYQEDVDLGYRLWLMGYKIVYVPTSIVYHKFGGSWGGLESPFRIYYCERNRYMVMFKNFEIQNLIKGILISIPYVIFRILLLLLSNNISGIKYEIKAHIDFLKNFKKIVKKRKEIQKKRVVRDSDIKKMGLYANLRDCISDYLRIISQSKN